MLSQTAEMKTLDDLMCAIDGEGWSSNSAPEMAYILADAVTFTKLQDLTFGLPELKLVDCGDKVVGVRDFRIENFFLNHSHITAI